MTQEASGDGLTRRALIRAGAVGAAAMSAGGLIAACGGASTSGGSSASQTSQPAGGTAVKGGTLRVGAVGSGAAETIDVRKVILLPDYMRGAQLYDPMFFVAPYGRAAPGVIETAEHNADATVWTLHVRRGVVFHNGKPLTADDIVFTITNSWLSKEGANSALFAQLIDAKGIRKRDKFTVEVPLRRAIADFPVLTTYNNLQVVQEGASFTSGIGTGPFKLTSFTPGVRSIMAANHEYWDTPKPYVDTVIVDSTYTTETARFNALLAGDIDIAPVVYPNLAFASSASGRVVVGVSPGPGFDAISMHVDRPPFNDPRVVQAMKYLVQRPQIGRAVWNGHASVGNDLPGYGAPYYASHLTRAHDPEKAKSLLKAAGQERLTETLYTSNLGYGANETAELYSAQAKAAGPNLPVRVIDPSEYYAPNCPGGPYPQKPFSTNVWDYGSNSLTPFYLFTLWSGAPYGETGWTHRGAADKLLFDALGETDPAKAEQKWFAVQELQFNEGGYIIPVTQNFIDGYSPQVRGIKTTPAGACNNFDFKSAWLAK